MSLTASMSTGLPPQEEFRNGDMKSPVDVGVPKRGQWTNKAEFFLSCLGFAVGLGNVWRFPYLCYRNGGGAFLIPYVIMLTLCGLPLFFLELALAQYHGQGPNIIFKHLAPAFHGLGFGMLVVTLLITLYYNMIIAWTIFYVFATFSSSLGWATCGHEWNTPGCFSESLDIECRKQNLTYWNNTCSDVKDYCESLTNFSYLNETHCLDAHGNASSATSASERVTPSEDYYLHYMLGASPSLDEFGHLRWQLVLCLLLAWLLVALCLIKGVRSSGKVVYFTAIFPYVVLIILFIRGVTLEGAMDGIYFYIVPEWNKLMNAQAWGDAAVQIFYSLGPGSGGLLTLSSYNKFNNNCYRDAVFIAVANCGTSVFAGFVIFSIMGFMAHTLGVPVDKVVKSGPGLAFVAYPEAVTKMPLSQLWAFLFFFMLITLGIDSQFTMCETLITAAHDEWPSLRQHSSIIVIVICGICFLLGLPLCAQGGVYLFTLIDWYSAGWSLLILSLLEVCLVSWLYGIDKFKDNIAEMIGHSPNIYWHMCWRYLSPATLLGILIFSFINYQPASFGSYVFPVWANAFGWLLAFSSVAMVPIFGIYQIQKIWKHKNETVRSAFRATAEWGPSQGIEHISKGAEVNELRSVTGENQVIVEEYNNPAFIDDAKY